MALKPVHNETELLHGISLDDVEAFADLFRAYHNAVGAFVNTLTDSPEMAEEIVQDVFVKIWMERKSLPQIEKFTSYLFILTRNYTLNCIRRQVKVRRLQEEYYLTAKSAHFEDTDPSQTEPDYLLLLDRAVAQLPPQQQKVFTLRKEGLRNPEIAVEMGISIDSVKKYQQLALRSVSEFVKSHATVSLMLACIIC